MFSIDALRELYRHMEWADAMVWRATYHRGQVNTWLRELGLEPPLVDFIAWVWFGKPAPDWSHPSIPVS